MDKYDVVYREHSAKEHFFLAVMILLAFFILTSSYNPDILPSVSLTGAAVATTFSPIAVLGIILLLLIIGIIISIVLWWRNHKKIQVQRVLQQDVESIVKAAGAGKSSKPLAAVDPLTRKLNKVEQELVDIPIRSAEKGHILKSISPEYERVPVKPAGSLQRLLHPHPKPKAHTKLPPRPSVRHPVKHRESLQDKMLQIQKEIEKVKTRG